MITLLLTINIKTVSDSLEKLDSKTIVKKNRLQTNLSSKFISK